MSLAGVIPGDDAGPLWSDSVSWTDLTVPVSVAEGAAGLDLEGARVLLALDFAGDLVDVVSQPLRLRFEAGGKSREHIPDFLAVTRSGTWLIDVRPERLVKDADMESFAAAAEAAGACGWA